MKSVGETMAIGRTFREALQKAVRSLEIKRFGLMIDLPEDVRHPREFLGRKAGEARIRCAFSTSPRRSVTG